ncbi:MAG: hypothetical protein OXG72_21165, partial [Acidobacteria bacterium]|nr:hypothetical protein [Acidobacteriota bacterium]
GEVSSNNRDPSFYRVRPGPTARAAECRAGLVPRPRREYMLLARRTGTRRPQSTPDAIQAY